MSARLLSSKEIGELFGDIIMGVRTKSLALITAAVRYSILLTLLSSKEIGEAVGDIIIGVYILLVKEYPLTSKLFKNFPVPSKVIRPVEDKESLVS
jgi:hypothetical protein